MSQVLAEVQGGIARFNNYFPTGAQDVVGVFTTSPELTQVFSDAQSVRVSVRPVLKAMEHPIETGATSIDHVVIQPLTIELLVILKTRSYRNTYDEVQRLFNEATVLTVQTKAAIYENLILEAIPHEETPERFNSIAMSMKLKQILFFETLVTNIAPRNAGDSNTVDRGLQQGAEPPAANAAAASLGYKLVYGNATNNN